ncbi:hypothetical protein CQ054_14375 [Ochrobactrum sp. MYb29]|nr:hypothetical protein CQ054_14375 [Ochrobactrum sp. MYb29]
MYPLFVVQGFTACRWGVIPDAPIQVDTEDHALRLAHRLACEKPAVLALYRWNNETQIIVAIGRVPDSALEAVVNG